MKKCPKCSEHLLFTKDEKDRGHCSSCEVATWPESKKKLIGRLVAAGLHKDTETVDQCLEDWNRMDGRWPA